MQPSTGQTATHCGESKCPSHSVHFLGSITNVPFFSRIAVFGHSGSQAEQPVQVDAMIFSAMSNLRLNVPIQAAAALNAPWRIAASPRAWCSMAPLATRCRYAPNHASAAFSMNSFA
jgi:hypothetical protein